MKRVERIRELRNKISLILSVYLELTIDLSCILELTIDFNYRIFN